MNLENFTAADAKTLIVNVFNTELESVLRSIYDEALKGENELFIYFSLNKKTVSTLNQKGFKIENVPNIAIQKDGLYHVIRW
jgi:hypothetical protein